LHFNYNLLRKKATVVGSTLPYPTERWVEIVVSRLINKSKPHVLLVPTWNPEVSRKIGIGKLMEALKIHQVNLYSVGFERNRFWQKLSADRILPVPYVVTTHLSRGELGNAIVSTQRANDFVFYAGDPRRNAIQWAGCNRSMVLRLERQPNAYVRLYRLQDKKRLSQTQYNNYLLNADYCLILCGDTPTSRSLTSAMLFGCIPLFVGSRLHGRCVPPCKPGWGWEVVSHIDHAHLPFANTINWDIFPQVDEDRFINDPVETLAEVFARTTVADKARIRTMMLLYQNAWIYGWGDPVNSTEFGGVVSYIWDTLSHVLRES
jgi:hypothetical protein